MILIIYGPAWEMTAPLLIPLSLAMSLYVLKLIESSVLGGLGKPQYEMRIQWFIAFIAIIVLAAASRISLILTAWMIPVIYGLSLILITRSIIIVLSLNWKQVMRPVLSGIFLAGVVGVSWNLGVHLLPIAWSLWARVGIQSMMAGSCWLIVMFIGRSWFLPDWEIISKILLVKRDT